MKNHSNPGDKQRGPQVFQIFCSYGKSYNYEKKNVRKSKFNMLFEIIERLFRLNFFIQTQSIVQKKELN